MSGAPSVACRLLVASLLLGLSIPSTPDAVLAQDEPGPVPVSDAFQAQGDSGQADAAYAWTITDPGMQWRLEASGPPGETVSLALADAAGGDLGRSAGADRAALFDLALSPGEYVARVRRTGGETFPFVLTGTPETESFDAEPNDRPEEAVPLGDGVEMIGRLAGIGSDEDVFALTIPPADANVREILLRSASQSERELCLSDREDQQLQCRRAAGAVGLTDLVLAPGSYYLRVRGTADVEAGYTLRVDQVGIRVPDREAEPNDEFESASAFDALLGVEGSSSRQDFDFHRVSIEGEPQLWRVRATGPQLDRMSWVRGHGAEVAVATPQEEGGAVELNDLYLVPGEHRFRIRTLGGDYRLEMAPLGPPDPEAEREPNDEDTRAEAYRIGERKLGRLATIEDVDRFRLTLAAPEHLRLRLEQPADADIEVRLNSGSAELLRYRAAEPGGLVDLDLWLRPGDLLLSLLPRASSDATYALTTERLDPFTLSVDQEPNGDPVTAGHAPSSLAWDGRGDPAGDLDATWLPPLSSPGPVTIRIETERPSVRLHAGDSSPERLVLELNEDGEWVANDVPTAVPLYLEIQADGPYSVALDAPGWDPRPLPVAPPLELGLDLAVDTVAAYWPEAQRIDGTVSLANMGDDDLEVVVEAVTSHYAWDARADATTMTLLAGSTQAIPLSVHVRPDAWADEPVLVSVAARAADGGQVTASATLDASPTAAPVNAATGWSVPDALLGGLNVAGQALGGRALGTASADREPLLFDGVTPAGAGFGLTVSGYPFEMIVDLAGDEPIPIAGTIINPLAGGFRLSQLVREFELLLSADGETWQSALTGELQPIPIDQAFVLAEPMPASQAMLRIHSDHSDDGRGNAIVLGEWKVVAQPGVAPDPMPANIAQPVRGGHVVRHEPFVGNVDLWYSMIDDTTRRQPMRVDRAEGRRDDRFEVVVGFQDGRAAGLTELGWRDPDGSDPETRLAEVDVEFSVDGPLGPWRSMGPWELLRATDGSVATFALDEPAWARYVRLSAPLDEEVREVEAPAGIEVFERATDEDYRSILGEWGYTSRQGPYEWLVPGALSAVELGADAGDTRETATALVEATPRTDRAEILEDVDWYRVDVPPGANTLTLDVAGTPTADVRLTLFDASGSPQEAGLLASPGGSQRYEAAVEPGAAYHVLVEQIPFNVAFTFDTSGSMGPFLDFVLEGMRAFAADVQPGREVVMIFPFGDEALLDAWQDQPDLLEDAVNNYVPTGSGSSDAEAGLLASAQQLAAREGTRAILVVTDAETGSLHLTPDVWSAFDEVQPIVYSVHVGASDEPFVTRNLMRSWADANGGHYAYPTTHAEMERAFERMSTRLRRPAMYSLQATTSAVDRDPASLSVVAPEGQPAALAPGLGIEIILDTSGSMRKGIDGVRRIEIAKASMRELLTETLAEGVPLAIRTFGGKGKGAGCQTRLPLPLAPLDRETALRFVRKLDAPKKASTPIAAALSRVPDDLADVEGSRIVVLITDGAESCGGDPEAAIAGLREGGFDVNLNIVGFALGDEELKAQLAGWAAAGAGSYFDAGSAGELAEAISTAVSAPFRVYATGGDPGAEAEPVASGTVGGEAVVLEPGSYRVEVLTDPGSAFEDVVLDGGAHVSLEIPGAAGADPDSDP